MICHWWLYGRKWPSPPLPKRKVGAPQYRTSPRNMKSSQHLVTRHEKKKNSPHKKIFVGRGSIYHGKEGYKYRLPEIYWGWGPTLTLFFFLLEICIHYFSYWEFSSPTWKKSNHPHLKCQFPPKIPIWPKSLLYQRSEKWLSPCSPITQRGCELLNTLHKKLSQYAKAVAWRCSIKMSQKS